MAYKSTEDYLNEYIKANQAQKNAAIADVNAIKQSSINAINEQANKNIAAYEKGFTEGVMESEEAADNVREKNAINRALNERYINERMANLGLAGSGYENAIRAGNEAYFKNTNENISADNQKAIDTLAATLKKNKEAEDLWRVEQTAKSTFDAEKDIYDIEKQLETDAQKYANKQVSNDNKVKIAQIDLEKNLDKKDDYDEPYYSDSEKAALVEKYIINNGADLEYLKELDNGRYEYLYYQDWTPQDWRNFFLIAKEKGVSEGIISKEIARLSEKGILQGQNFAAAGSVTRTR